MKATIRYNRTRTIVGDLTFSKALNLYRVITKRGNLYLTPNSLNYAVTGPSPKRKTASRKRKK